MPDMAGDPTARPLLPQTTQAQSFSFAPQVLGSREPQQKSTAIFHATNSVLTVFLPDYVFVDEHNRHKRLKGATPSPCQPT
jgi:hypothetical protein